MQEGPFQGQDRGTASVERARLLAPGHGLRVSPRGRVPQECLLAVVLIPAALLIPVGGTERALLIASVLLVLYRGSCSIRGGGRGRQDLAGKITPSQSGRRTSPAPRYS